MFTLQYCDTFSPLEYWQSYLVENTEGGYILHSVINKMTYLIMGSNISVTRNYLVVFDNGLVIYINQEEPQKISTYSTGELQMFFLGETSENHLILQLVYPSGTDFYFLDDTNALKKIASLPSSEKNNILGNYGYYTKKSIVPYKIPYKIPYIGGNEVPLKGITFLSVSSANGLGIDIINTGKGTIFCKIEKDSLRILWKTPNYPSLFNYPFSILEGKIFDIWKGKSPLKRSDLDIIGITETKDGIYTLWLKIDNRQRKLLETIYTLTSDSFHQPIDKLPAPLILKENLYPYYHYLMTGEFCCIITTESSGEKYLNGYNDQGHRIYRETFLVPASPFRLIYPERESLKIRKIINAWKNGFEESPGFKNSSPEEKINKIKAFVGKQEI